MVQSSWVEFYNHTPGRIDVDRGVTARRGMNGVKVAMYKRQPGMFLSPMGVEVDDDVAREVGFDVDSLRKEAQILKQIKEATDKIKTQAAGAEAKIRETAKQEKENPFEEPIGEPGTPTEFNKAGDPRGTKNYVMDYHGGGYWNVVSRETGTKVLERVKANEAIAGMYDAERDHIDVSDGAESA